MDTLTEIGRRFGSDKFTRHNFGPIYEKMFDNIRESATKILEIGIGGENYADGGESLNTWKEYFHNASILGIDIYDKNALNCERIQTKICDQTNLGELTKIAREHGPFDVIIDDGSHIGCDAVDSLRVLFDYLRPGGMYVIEDLQTSYWSNYGGSSIAPDWFNTTVRWLKGAVDIINRDEMVVRPQDSSDFSLDLGAIHVFHNISFVQKGISERSGSSNVLNDEMRNNLYHHDKFYNEDLGKLYELLRCDEESFRQLMCLIHITDDATEEDLLSLVEDLPRKETVFVSRKRIGEVRKMAKDIDDQNRVITDLQSHISTLTDYIRATEESHEKDRSTLQSYIHLLEDEKQNRELVLQSHSLAIKNYEAYTSGLKDYIQKLELHNRQE